MKRSLGVSLFLLCVTGCQLLKPPQVNNMELKGNFQGSWSVNSLADTPVGQAAPGNTCQDSAVQITQTSTTLYIAPRSFNCQYPNAVGFYTVGYQAMSLTLSGNNVLYLGQTVGNKADSTLTISIPLPWGALWQFSLTVNGQVLNYKETMGGTTSTTTGAFHQ